MGELWLKSIVSVCMTMSQWRLCMVEHSTIPGSWGKGGRISMNLSLSVSSRLPTPCLKITATKLTKSIFKIKQQGWGGGSVSEEDLNLIPQTLLFQKDSVVSWTSNPSTGKGKSGDRKVPGTGWQARLAKGEPQVPAKDCLKNKMDGA